MWTISLIDNTSRDLGHLPLKKESTGLNPVRATKIKDIPCIKAIMMKLIT